MDVWNSPPSVGLDKRKEYVVSRMKEGYELLVSPKRVRLFKVGSGYIPCAVQIFRKMMQENLLLLVSEDDEEAVYKLNVTAKVKIERAKPAPRVVEEDEDEADTFLIEGTLVDVDSDEEGELDEEDLEEETDELDGLDEEFLNPPPIPSSDDEYNDDDEGEPEESYEEDY